MKVKVHGPTSILVAAALVVAADGSVMPVLRQGLYRRASTTIVFAFDFGIVLLAGMAGFFFASRVGCPGWWRSGKSKPASRRVTLITLLVAVFVVAGNTLVCVASRNQLTELAPWLVSLTPGTALALAFRAALTENIVFRLFLFPLVAWGVGHFIRSQRGSLVVGALASAFVYGLIHPGFVAAFLGGLAVLYIYHQRGLLPAMAVHFFGDAIPFVWLSMML